MPKGLPIDSKQMQQSLWLWFVSEWASLTKAHWKNWGEDGLSGRLPSGLVTGQASPHIAVQLRVHLERMEQLVFGLNVGRVSKGIGF
jgi:hypothetical protein